MKTALALMVALTAFAQIVCSEDEIKFKHGVTFPHKQHQETLKDCTICHSQAPPGKIEGMGKDWIHNKCKGCHTSANTIDACLHCHKQ